MPQHMTGCRRVPHGQQGGNRKRAEEAAVLWGARKSEIERLYFGEGWSQAGLAQHYGVAKSALRKAMIRLNIPYHERRGDWTEERLALLTRLCKLGHSARFIAEQLGNVTRNAVIGKANRLGLSVQGQHTRSPRSQAKPRRNIPKREGLLVRNFIAKCRVKGLSPTDTAQQLQAQHGIIKSVTTIKTIASRSLKDPYPGRSRRRTGPKKPWKRIDPTHKSTPGERTEARKAGAKAISKHRQWIIDRYGPEPEPIGTRDAIGCRYIHGDPKDDFRFCSLDQHDQTSWCKWHLYLVSAPPRYEAGQPTPAAV